MVAYAIAQGPDPMSTLQRFEGFDWMWLIFLGAMMVGTYYFLAVYLADEDAIAEDFVRLDKDHDGFITREDASAWQQLAKVFDSFDMDRDGRISRIEFEEFEHSLAR
jgi:hypothetical protein